MFHEDVRSEDFGDECIEDSEYLTCHLIRDVEIEGVERLSHVRDIIS